LQADPGETTNLAQIHRQAASNVMIFASVAKPFF
jgi:hypothetical protein